MSHLNESTSKKKEKPPKSIEDVSFNDPKERVGSPHSLRALGELGIEVQSLYYLSFTQFLHIHPEIRNVSKDLQLQRYDHFEEKRKSKIEQVREKRKELVEKDDEYNNTKSSNNQEGAPKRMPRSKSTLEYIKDQQSTLIKSEREKLKLLKNQQMGELKNIIEFEFRMEEIRKRNEQKLKAQHEKEEEVRKNREQMQKEREKQQKIQQQKKEERQKAEQEEFEKRQKEREEEEKKMHIEEMKRKEEIEKERQKEIMENKKKQEMFRKKIEDILQNKQNDLIEKQKEYQKKEEERNENLARIKKELYMRNLERCQKENEKIQKCLNRNDSNKNSKQSDYEKKQKYAEEMRMKYAQEREEKKKKHELLLKKKEQEIQEIIKRNEDSIQKKIDEYNKKQELIAERQKEREQAQKEEMVQRQKMLDEKEKKCIEARKKSEKILTDNREKLIQKINCSQEKIIKQKEDNLRTFMKKFIEFNMRKDDIQDNIRQKELSLEYQRQKRLEEIEEKNKRLEEIRKQKMEIFELRRKMQMDLQKQKQRMLIRFDYIMKNSKNKSKDEIMSELFDDKNNRLHSNKMSKSRSIANITDNDDGKHGNFQFLTNLQGEKKRPTKTMDDDNEYNDFNDNDNNINIIESDNKKNEGNEN